jgi:mono/diheme cytochrome c family protein
MVLRARGWIAGIFVLATGFVAAQQSPEIPRTWDDGEIARHEVPLAQADASPKHVSSDYYYRIRVRPIYKSYPVYAYGHEPSGYFESLKQQEPVIIWDDKSREPTLQTDSDWVRAGEVVFDAPLVFNTNVTVEDLRDPRWLSTTGAPVARDGTIPGVQYVVRKKGVVELGNNSCAFCHTRVMPDGSTLKGAQGNLPIQRAVAFRWRAAAAAASDKNQYTVQTRTFLKRLHAAPYLNPDPQDQIDSMSIEEMSALFDSYPAGVSLRQRGNSFLPIQVPDLIGVKDRRYLDRTGLEIQRSIGDMMRYAALNQGADSLASYAGFIPVDAPRYRERPGPEQFTRYSDEQLYALARYIYSLEPPANPNAFDNRAARGKQVFEDEGCATCHRPPLYTNNRLTPAIGFTVPDDHREKFDVMSRSVGTDPELALRTRRGTGYYKVPSLKGVWYRGMFGHSGWAATLEDWFDPRRLRDDYVPTGWKPFRARTYPVKGHPFGLDLSAKDRGALIAFLKTL